MAMLKSSAVKNPKPVESYISYQCRNRIINPCVVPNGKFEEQTTNKFGQTGLKIAVMKTEYGYFIHPIERCHKHQFEEFFGFGCGNIGFDEKRIVYLPLA